MAERTDATRTAAAALVDRWAADWRQHLDGRLHKSARLALIDLLESVAVGDAPDPAAPRLRLQEIKAYGERVRLEEAAERARHAPTEPGPLRLLSPDEAAPPVPNVCDEADGPPQDEPAAAGGPDAARDALALLREAHGGRVLFLTPRQVARFSAFGLLDGVAYEVSEPMPTAAEPVPTEVDAPERRGRGRPRKAG